VEDFRENRDCTAPDNGSRGLWTRNAIPEGDAAPPPAYVIEEMAVENEAIGPLDAKNAGTHAGSAVAEYASVDRHVLNGDDADGAIGFPGDAEFEETTANKEKFVGSP
jgi:hypothetical protein